MVDVVPHVRKTPPDLKWLLNERASIQGALESMIGNQNRLERKAQALRRRLKTAESSCQACAEAIRRLSANLLALDTSISLMHDEANPSALGSVRAWASKYGERGALTSYIADCVRNAAPAAVSMTDLTDMAAAHFGRVLLVPEDRRSFRKSIGSALRTLRKRGRFGTKEEAMNEAIWRATA